MDIKLTTVMYHYVRPINISKFPGLKALDLQEFKNQISYFKKHYNFITTTDLILFKNHKIKLPKNPLILTFDDGYVDHYKYVFPILKKNKINGTFFPVAKSILENKILNVNKIQLLLTNTNKLNKIISYMEKMIELSDLNKKSLKFYKKKYSNFKRNRFDIPKVNYIKRLLQVGLHPQLRKKLLDFLFKKYVTSDEKDLAKNFYLSQKNLKEMANYGMEVGGHGYEHHWLNNLTMKEQKKDINKSFKFIDKVKNKNQKLIFCYPYGGYNPNTITILKSLNFDAAFTTNIGLVNCYSDNMLELPRLDTNDFPKSKNFKISKWTKLAKHEK